MTDRAATGEDALLSWLRRRSEKEGGRLIGDDAAVLPENDFWAVTMDTQIEGVHFHAGLDPRVLARRLLAVNLSDLAAMGADPAWIFLALAAPAGFDHRSFFAALLRAARAHRCELAGGDLAQSPQLTMVLTLLGKKPADRRWLTRSAARAGDVLWLGGSVGESAAGAVLMQNGARLAASRVFLPPDFVASNRIRAAARRAVKRHLTPRPQLDLGRWLGSARRAAAIDLSDGLARDLHRLCRESSVGAEIDLETLPLSPDFAALAAALERSWQNLALGGGEDYVLLFALPAGVVPPENFGCRPIGQVRSAPGIYLIDHGRKTPLPPLGWDHLQRPD